MQLGRGRQQAQQAGGKLHSPWGANEVPLGSGMNAPVVDPVLALLIVLDPELVLLAAPAPAPALALPTVLAGPLVTPAPLVPVLPPAVPLPPNALFAPVPVAPIELEGGPQEAAAPVAGQLHGGATVGGAVNTCCSPPSAWPDVVSTRSESLPSLSSCSSRLGG